MVHHLTAMGRHLPYGIPQYYLSPTQANAPRLNPSHAGWCSIFLPQRDGRLSWPSWVEPVTDLSITSPTPNHCTTKTTILLLLTRQRLQSSTTDSLFVSAIRLSTVGRRAFPVTGAHSWNDLLSHITSSSSLLTFKQRLKCTYFMCPILISPFSCADCNLFSLCGHSLK